MSNPTDFGKYMMSWIFKEIKLRIPIQWKTAQGKMETTGDIFLLALVHLIIKEKIPYLYHMF